MAAAANPNVGADIDTANGKRFLLDVEFRPFSVVPPVITRETFSMMAAIQPEFEGLIPCDSRKIGSIIFSVG